MQMLVFAHHKKQACDISQNLLPYYRPLISYFCIRSGISDYDAGIVC